MTAILIANEQPAHRLAAETFRDLWRLVTGHNLAITTTPPEDGPLIILGSDAVNALAEKGLVERRPSPSDRRAGEVVPTDVGVSLVDRAEGWAGGCGCRGSVGWVRRSGLRRMFPPSGAAPRFPARCGSWTHSRLWTLALQHAWRAISRAVPSGARAPGTRLYRAGASNVVAPKYSARRLPCSGYSAPRQAGLADYPSLDAPRSDALRG